MIRAYAKAGKKPLLGFKEIATSQSLPRLASLALALLLSLSACARPFNEEKAASTAPGSTASRSGAGQPAVKNDPLDPETIAVQDFSVREESGQTILALKFSKPISQYRHFPLTQPARIVVDVFGNAVLPADMNSFRVGTNLVGTVRLSSAQGSLRVSIDAISAELPVYSVAPDDGGIKIVVGSADPKITANRELTLVRGGKRMDNIAAQAKSLVTDTQSAPVAAGTAMTDSKKYTGQKLSFDFKDADIKNIFRLLAEVSGRNIVVTSDVNRRVTLRLVEVPWDQAMDLLISTNGLDQEEIGNVVRISTLPQMKSDRDARAANQKAKENEESLQTVYFNVNYAKVKDLEGKVKTVLSKRPDVSLVVDERSNTIMIRDVKKSIDDAIILMAKLDTRTPQVLIESNLIETTPTFARALGFRFQFTSGGTTFSSAAGAGSPFTGNTAGAFPSVPNGLGGTLSVAQAAVGGLKNLASALEAAESEGNIRIISRPSVVTLNNIASTIRSERILRIPLPSSTNIATGSGSSAAGAAVATEKIPVGIILTVTPQVSSDGYVLMNINVKSSSLAANPTGGNNVIPFDELNREAVANVLVRDGETIVLGGILKDTASSSEAGIPYLKDIPVFGWLFKSNRVQKDFEELMVFITPRITDAGVANLPAAEQLWRDKMKTTYGEKQGPAGINP